MTVRVFARAKDGAREELRVHELKCVPPYFEDVFEGRKTFEVRANDRGFAVGDVLYLREFVAGEASGVYTGKNTLRLVTYLLDDKRFLASEYVVLGIRGLDGLMAIRKDVVGVDVEEV